MNKQLKDTYKKWQKMPDKKNTYTFILSFAKLLRNGIEDIEIYEEEQKAIMSSIADIIDKFQQHFFEILPSLKNASSQLDPHNESSLTNFMNLRDSIELCYQLIWPYAMENKQREPLKNIRKNLDAIDDQILIDKSWVLALHEVAIEKKMINLDPDYYWWIPSEYQQNYVPRQRLAEYTTKYVDNKIYKQQIDMKLFQLFKDIDHLDVVYELENDLSLEKMHEEQHSFFCVLNHQSPRMAASAESVTHSKLTWYDAQKKYKVQTFIQSKNQPQIFFTIEGEKTPHKLCIGTQEFAVQSDAEQGVYCQIDRSTLQKIIDNFILIDLQFVDSTVTLSPHI